MYRNDLDEQVDEILRLLKKNRLNVCNVIPAQFRYPSLLCAQNEVVRRDSVNYIISAINNAKKLDAPSVHLCAGMVAWDKDEKVGWKQLRKSFEEISEYVSDNHITLYIEPAHKFESNLIRTIDDGLRMIDELKSDKFGILLDTGHCHVNGEIFQDVVPKCKGIPLHIHADDNNADFDTHLVPGKGSVDFINLSRELEKISYAGYISAELGGMYIMDPTSACRDTLSYFRKVFPH